LKVWLGKETQDKIAEGGFYIPMVKGTAELIKEQFYKAIAQEAATSQWIQIAMDQLLGPDTGRVFNDVSAEVAAGDASAEQAAKTIQDSWNQNKM
jgi:raffinose/stachyose/melibiose transport system substrate-binding protein